MRNQENFYEKLHNMIKPLFKAMDGPEAKSKSSRSQKRRNRMSGEYKSEETLKKLEKQNEQREIEEYGKDIEGMHHHNQRLLDKHGHAEAPKL